MVDVTPAEIKKFATGKGTASKEEMTAAARNFLLLPNFEQLGAFGSCSQFVPDVLGEHEADAICGLFYALKHCAAVVPKKRKSK